MTIRFKRKQLPPAGHMGLLVATVTRYFKGAGSKWMNGEDDGLVDVKQVPTQKLKNLKSITEMHAQNSEQSLTNKTKHSMDKRNTSNSNKTSQLSKFFWTFKPTHLPISSKSVDELVGDLNRVDRTFMNWFVQDRLSTLCVCESIA